jgi:hypothetical protein
VAAVWWWAHRGREYAIYPGYAKKYLLKSFVWHISWLTMINPCAEPCDSTTGFDATFRVNKNLQYYYFLMQKIMLMVSILTFSWEVLGLKSV